MKKLKKQGKSWFAAKNPKKQQNPPLLVVFKKVYFEQYPPLLVVFQKSLFWTKPSTFGGFQNPPLLVVFLDWKFILKYFFGNKKSQKTGKILNLDTLT